MMTRLRVDDTEQMQGIGMRRFGYQDLAVDLPGSLEPARLMVLEAPSRMPGQLFPWLGSPSTLGHLTSKSHSA